MQVFAKRLLNAPGRCVVIALAVELPVLAKSS